MRKLVRVLFTAEGSKDGGIDKQVPFFLCILGRYTGIDQAEMVSVKYRKGMAGSAKNIFGVRRKNQNL